MADLRSLQHLKYYPFVPSDRHGPDEFKDLASFVGLPIPSEFLAFLRQYPDTGMFNVDGVVGIQTAKGWSCAISMMYGACSDARYDLREVRRMTPPDVFPEYLLQVGDDLFGNVFVMDLRPDFFGKVYFWDHEQSVAEDGLNEVAPDFATFLQRLEVEG